MSTKIDKEQIREAYNDVRNDNSETNWVVLKHQGNVIELDSTGESYEDFQSHFADDERVFGFVRVFTGDELSRRAKFALLSWVGHAVSPLKRAKMSTDKALVKEVISSFAIELLATEKEELTEEFIKQELIKAGGANYGTGEH